MSKIFRTTFFLLVLVGLLTWGVSTLAQAPTQVSGLTVGNVTLESAGQEIQAREGGSLDSVRHVGR